MACAQHPWLSALLATLLIALDHLVVNGLERRKDPERSDG
ncbi:hypothetical protein SAZ_09890 [Streptomyces noursei ZPM]|nr:hypothetical protein SAZ_09890 [Streptomyces noursei ZPM]EPY93361.1 hypothetical protein K530_48395 [Streptomyces noursei CCRC 11814]